MSLSVQDQVKYWGFATILIIVVLWSLGDVLLPFVLGGAIAYFLDPVADRLERMGLSRNAATGVITVGGILAFIIATLLIVPTLVKQMADLIETAPQLASDLGTFLKQRFPDAVNEDSLLRKTLTTIGETVKARGGEVFDTVMGSAMSLFNMVVLLVIVPVVAVYMLVDWDQMMSRIDDLLPRDHAPVIRRLAGEIDATLASFIRGMGTVCLILGTYYAVSLMLVGLNFGLAVGFIAGLVTFIPYLGALIGGALAIGLALFQFWGDWTSIGIVAAIFVGGQMIEGNYLTPKLVGNSVGLQPVWLLLALSVFGSLFGFVGMLVAVPLAAALGVIARFATEEYKKGRLYLGISAGGDN